jgi:hypothetical protein
MNSKSKSIIGAIVAIGCYYLPIILSGVIYVTLICSKRKMLKNKIEALDDEIINSENQVLGNIVLDHQLGKNLNSIPKNDVILLKEANSHNAEILNGNQEVEIQNSKDDCDVNKLTEEVKDTSTSHLKAENNHEISNVNSDENILQMQQENELNVPVVLNCLSLERSTPSPSYDSIEIANDIATADIDLKPKHDKQKTNSIQLVMVQEIQPTNNDKNLPTLLQAEHKDNSINYPNNKTDSDENTEAQILAAKRSLITNLVLIGQSLLIALAIPIIEKEYLPFYAVFTCTILKGALPICTTIVNYGTVANMISKYWEYLKNKIN